MRCNLHMVKFQHPLLPPRALPLRNKKTELLQKFKPPRSGKIINICAVKNVTTRGSPQNCYGGKPKNDPPHIEKNVIHLLHT